MYNWNENCYFYTSDRKFIYSFSSYTSRVWENNEFSFLSFNLNIVLPQNGLRYRNVIALTFVIKNKVAEYKLFHEDYLKEQTYGTLTFDPKLYIGEIYDRFIFERNEIIENMLEYEHLPADEFYNKYRYTKTEYKRMKAIII